MARLRPYDLDRDRAINILIVHGEDDTFGWSVYWMDGTGGGASGITGTRDAAKRQAREAIARKNKEVP